MSEGASRGALRRRGAADATRDKSNGSSAHVADDADGKPVDKVKNEKDSPKGSSPSESARGASDWRVRVVATIVAVGVALGIALARHVHADIPVEVSRVHDSSDEPLEPPRSQPAPPCRRCRSRRRRATARPLVPSALPAAPSQKLSARRRALANADDLRGRTSSASTVARRTARASSRCPASAACTTATRAPPLRAARRERRRRFCSSTVPRRRCTPGTAGWCVGCVRAALSHALPDIRCSRTWRRVAACCA